MSGTTTVPLQRANPEELEGYQQALKETFRQDCELRHDASECHRLAEFYQVIEKNLQKANETYRYARNECVL